MTDVDTHSPTRSLAACTCMRAYMLHGRCRLQRGSSAPGVFSSLHERPERPSALTGQFTRCSAPCTACEPSAHQIQAKLPLPRGDNSTHTPSRPSCTPPIFLRTCTPPQDCPAHCPSIRPRPRAGRTPSLRSRGLRTSRSLTSPACRCLP